MVVVDVHSVRRRSIFVCPQTETRPWLQAAATCLDTTASSEFRTRLRPAACNILSGNSISAHDLPVYFCMHAFILDKECMYGLIATEFETRNGDGVERVP